MATKCLKFVRKSYKSVITMGINRYHFTTNSNTSSRSFRRMFDKTNYSNYNEFYSSFEWKIPSIFNIGYECSDYHVDNGDGDKIALIDHTSNKQYTFNEISLLSNKLSNSLKDKLNIFNGDRISILLPQSLETGITHLSTFKLGCISLPLFILFGADALLFRLSDSETKAIITNQECLPIILSIRNKLPHLQHIIVTGKNIKDCNDYHSFESLISSGSDSFEYKKTLCDDPAVIIYTSGTTGNPKGCLHAHRVLLGHLPGIETPHNFLPQKDDIFWTPADWAWIGGLLDALLPSWYYGIPIVAYRAKKFDVHESFDLMKKYNVTNTFLPPTALKMMKMVCEKEENVNNNDFKHDLRSIGSGGESLGEALHEWALNTFNTTINEFYGQTECNLIVSNSFNVFDVKPGSMGKVVPGHIVDIVDDVGNLVNVGKYGNIAVKYPDPVMFLNYWNNEKKTNEKFIINKDDNTKWMITGDLAKKDEDGYLYFDSRDDDVINTRGFRCGPKEIEDACLKHLYVLNAAAIGVPDELSNELIKVFIVLKEDYKNIENDSDEGDKLKNEIQDLVRNLVGKHEYPRYVEFIHELPMTITGKVQRKILKQAEYDKYYAKQQNK